jgi:PTH2 family peptidyl-tRNA hydrolase
MRKGKMIAQGAHASLSFLTRKIKVDYLDNYNVPLNKVQLEWLATSFAKVCVYVTSEKELLDIVDTAEFFGIECHLIQDSGKTEFGGKPTYTCCALGPDKAEEIDKITGHLPLL